MNKNIIGGKFFYDTNFLKKKKILRDHFSIMEEVLYLTF